MKSLESYIGSYSSLVFSSFRSFSAESRTTPLKVTGNSARALARPVCLVAKCNY